MEKVEIKSSKTDAILSFSNRIKDGYEVAYRSKDISVRIDVYEYAGYTPHDLFAEMAKHPNGWEGKLSWSSFEEELEFSATVDRSGHVELSLIFKRFAVNEHWRAETTFFTELGQLPKIAQDLQEFFGNVR